MLSESNWRAIQLVAESRLTLADLNNEAPASSSHRRRRLFTVREKNVLEPQNMPGIGQKFLTPNEICGLPIVPQLPFS